MAEEVRSVQPKVYYKQFLEKNVRPDNRELGECRPTVLNIGCVSTASGSSLVKLGNTSVICGVKAEVAKPVTERPNEGFIVPNVELSPLCSPTARPGPPGKGAQVLSQNMMDIILNSKCVTPESLCISEGKLAWVLHIDLVCLDYDGNLLDACTLALMAALRNTSLPTVVVDEETGDIKTDMTTQTMLKVFNCPVSTTFVVFEGCILLVDPTKEEEDLSTGLVSVVVEGDSLCSVYKPGGSPLTEEQMDKCFDRAFERAKEVKQLIDDTMCSVDR